MEHLTLTERNDDDDEDNDGEIFLRVDERI